MRAVFNVRKLFWRVPAFLLAWFVWQRIFIFTDDVFGLPQPRVRYILILAAALAGASLIPAVRRMVETTIAEYSKTGVAVRLIAAVAAIVSGPSVSLIGLSADIGPLSRAISAAGAVVAVFIILMLILRRLARIRSHVRSLLSAFLDMRFIAAVLLLNAYAVIYLLAARQPYFWDNAGYWRTAADLAALAFTAPAELFRHTLGSVFVNDYHYLPAVIPAYVMAVFNTGRLAFVLSIVNFYIVPFWAMIYAVSKRNGFSGFLTGVMALVFVPVLGVLGFLDVGGIIFAFACIYLFLYGSDDGFLSGLMLFATMIYRRWFLFFVMAFLLCALLYALPDRGTRKKLTLMLLGFGAPMLLLFQGYVSGVLLRDSYGDIYSAYSFAALNDVRFILRYFGLILIIGVFSYSIYSVLRKKEGFRGCFPICVCLLMFFLFVSIQSFGMQHLLLFAAPVAVICVRASRDRLLRAPAIAVAALCFAGVFVPREQPQALSEITNYALIPTFSVYSVIREDAEELASLDRFVRGLDGSTAVLASSFTLNSDLLALVDSSFNPLKPLDANEAIIHTAQVDKRDGLPLGLELADHIVTAYPVQTHLDPGDQRSVSVPAEAILNDTPFSAAFEKTDVEFNLRFGIKAYVFRRTRPNTEEETQWLWQAINYHQ